ncbi:MAG: glycoside hydrolase family 25 protein [Acetatifactor sp.]
MKLPEDYEEHSGMTPTVVMSIVAVTLLVAVILMVVLLMNDNKRNNRNSQISANQSISASSPIIEDDVESAAGGSKLTPDDLDFWDMYPPEETASPEPVEELPRETVENDPATDGKHTLIQYANGEEEWVLISPYLPKHEYDFTKLVCQSNLMKYYEDGKQVSYVGVDISKFQDYVDFVKVKKAGIDFVMLRVGARGYGTGQLILDEYFSDNLKRATDAGLEVGVYFFSQAITKEEAVEEANMVLENLGEYKISYPVAFDMELIENDTARTDTLSRSERTEITKAFLDTISAAGYKTIIYGNKEWLMKQIDMSKLTAYDVWLSQQTDIPDYPYKFTMWQYSLEGSVDGIAGYVDMDISFIDYSEK